MTNPNMNMELKKLIAEAIDNGTDLEGLLKETDAAYKAIKQEKDKVKRELEVIMEENRKRAEREKEKEERAEYVDGLWDHVNDWLEFGDDNDETVLNVVAKLGTALLADRNPKVNKPTLEAIEQILMSIMETLDKAASKGINVKVKQFEVPAVRNVMDSHFENIKRFLRDM